MTRETLKRMLLVLLPDLQDLLVFGGLGLASYGVSLVLGAGWASILAGAGLFWLGVKKP